MPEAQPLTGVAASSSTSTIVCAMSRCFPCFRCRVIHCQKTSSSILFHGEGGHQYTTTVIRIWYWCTVKRNSLCRSHDCRLWRFVNNRNRNRNQSLHATHGVIPHPTIALYARCTRPGSSRCTSVPAMHAGRVVAKVSALAQRVSFPYQNGWYTCVKPKLVRGSFRETSQG